MKKHTKCVELFQELINKRDTPKPQKISEAAALSGLYASLANALSSLDKRDVAVNMCKIALQVDPLNYDAFTKLCGFYWVTSYDVLEILEVIQIPHTARAIVPLYRAEAMSALGEIDMNAIPAQLRENLDVILFRAQGLFSSYNHSLCFEITKSVLTRYPHRHSFLPLHLCSSYQLRNSREIFYWAHKLMDSDPSNHLGSFAVGCYYYSLHDYENAKKFFSHSTAQYLNFLPAWIGVANSFVVESPEPALVAYRIACKLFPGSHFPYLYIGMEYLHTKRYSFSEDFLQSARAKNGSDPIIFNELGVLCYQRKRYSEAEEMFKRGLTLCKYKKFEPFMSLKCNLGQLYRKVGRYEESIVEFTDVLAFTRNAHVLASLALCYQFNGNTSYALSFYNKALSLDKDNALAKRMLPLAVEEDSARLKIAF